ncbi:rhodanese-like domain-containing protein [Candidatus Woesearchaeota archaeon]|nr:rhodanese-like domain-containing protein [Candidatus Woesearchaeota archaeon]
MGIEDKSTTNRLFQALVFAVFLLVMVVAIGCAVQKQPAMQTQIPTQIYKNTYKNMSVYELHGQLRNKDFVLIDVHIPEQVHLNGTDYVIPYNEIMDNLGNLPQDKNAKIVLYCRSGKMSQEAAEKLAAAGYTNIYNVLGGINEWGSMGYGVG